MTLSIKVKHVLQFFLWKTSRWLKLNYHLDLEITPANARQEERCFSDLDDRLSESLMQVVSYWLDELGGVIHTSTKRCKHGPTVRLPDIFFLVNDFAIFDELICVSKWKLNQAPAVEPFTSLFKRDLALLKLFAHRFRNLKLQVFVDLGDKLLIEVCSTHWARVTELSNFLLALEAHHVLAGSQHWLNAEFKANWAFIIVALCALDLLWWFTRGLCSRLCSFRRSRLSRSWLGSLCWCGLCSLSWNRLWRLCLSRSCCLGWSGSHSLSLGGSRSVSWGWLCYLSMSWPCSRLQYRSSYSLRLIFECRLRSSDLSLIRCRELIWLRHVIPRWSWDSSSLTLAISLSLSLTKAWSWDIKNLCSCCTMDNWITSSSKCSVSLILISAVRSCWPSSTRVSILRVLDSLREGVEHFLHTQKEKEVSFIFYCKS